MVGVFGAAIDIVCTLPEGNKKKNGLSTDQPLWTNDGRDATVLCTVKIE